MVGCRFQIREKGLKLLFSIREQLHLVLFKIQGIAIVQMQENLIVIVFCVLFLDGPLSQFYRFRLSLIKGLQRFLLVVRQIKDLATG